MKIKNKKIIKVILLCSVLLLFGAFGCKNADEQTTDTVDTTEQVDTEISFTTPQPTISTEDSTGDNALTGQETVSTDTALDNALTTLTDSDADENRSSDTNTINSSGTTDSTDANSEISTTNEIDTSDITESTSSDEQDVIKLAQVLAEIYGTFTNKDLEPYKNLQDLETYASEDMQAWIKSKVDSYQAPDNTSFYGITTKALSAAVLDSSATEYQILVTTEREVIDESQPDSQKYFQLVEMNFIKSGDEWLLDSAYWQ